MVMTNAFSSEILAEKKKFNELCDDECYQLWTCYREEISKNASRTLRAHCPAEVLLRDVDFSQRFELNDAIQ